MINLLLLLLRLLLAVVPAAIVVVVAEDFQEEEDWVVYVPCEEGYKALFVVVESPSSMMMMLVAVPETVVQSRMQDEFPVKECLLIFVATEDRLDSEKNLVLNLVAVESVVVIVMMKECWLMIAEESLAVVVRSRPVVIVAVEVVLQPLLCPLNPWRFLTHNHNSTDTT